MSQCVKMCQNAGFSPQIVASTQTWERIYNHVVELELVGFVSSLFAKPHSSRSPVRYFRIVSNYAALDHIVIYNEKNKLSNNARTYIDAAREFLLLQQRP